VLDDVLIGGHGHSHLAGDRRRAAVIVAIGVGLVVVGFLCGSAGSRPHAADGWVLGVLGGWVLAIAVFVLAARELRRPVQRGFDGRCRNSSIAAAELRWHPTYDSVYDELFQKVARLGAKGRRVVTELLIGEMTARLVFDRAPFRPGGRACMWFGAEAPRAAFDPDGFDFRLRCSRETPGGVQLFRRLARLADLEPAVCEYDEGEATFRLEFDLPPDAPGSDLLADEPVYWEFTFVIQDGASRYLGRFFVPVSVAAAPVSP